MNICNYYRMITTVATMQLILSGGDLIFTVQVERLFSWLKLQSWEKDLLEGEMLVMASWIQKNEQRMLGEEGRLQ